MNAKRITATVITGAVVAVIVVTFLVVQYYQNRPDPTPVNTYGHMVPHQAQFVSKCIRLTGHTSIWCLNWLQTHHH